MIFKSQHPSGKKNTRTCPQLDPLPSPPESRGRRRTSRGPVFRATDDARPHFSGWGGASWVSSSGRVGEVRAAVGLMRGWEVAGGASATPLGHRIDCLARPPSGSEPRSRRWPRPALGGPSDAWTAPRCSTRASLTEETLRVPARPSTARRAAQHRCGCPGSTVQRGDAVLRRPGDRPRWREVRWPPGSPGLSWASRRWSGVATVPGRWARSAEWGLRDSPAAPGQW